MGALFVLAGTLMIMYSVIVIVGENLKKDLCIGVCCLLTFPIFAFFYTFSIDYGRGHKPLFIGVGGLLLLIVGQIIGVK